MAHEGFLRFEKLNLGYEAAKNARERKLPAFGAAGQDRTKHSNGLPRLAEMFAREKNLVWPWLLDLYQGLHAVFTKGRLFRSPQVVRGSLWSFSMEHR